MRNDEWRLTRSNSSVGRLGRASIGERVFCGVDAMRPELEL